MNNYIMPFSNVICLTYIVPYSTDSCCTYTVSYSKVICHAYIMPYYTVTCHTYIVPSFSLLSHAVLSLCHMLLSHHVLTLGRTRLIEFCGTNNFVILFAHKEIHKLTWISPNQRDKEQIDHLLITGKWQRSLKDVHFRRGWMLAAITTLLLHTSNAV